MPLSDDHSMQILEFLNDNQLSFPLNFLHETFLRKSTSTLEELQSTLDQLVQRGILLETVNSQNERIYQATNQTNSYIQEKYPEHAPISSSSDESSPGTCCILGCYRKATIRNYSSLQVTHHQLKKNHPSRKICSRHYYEDIQARKNRNSAASEYSEEDSETPNVPSSILVSTANEPRSSYPSQAIVSHISPHVTIVPQFPDRPSSVQAISQQSNPGSGIYIQQHPILGQSKRYFPMEDRPFSHEHQFPRRSFSNSSISTTSRYRYDQTIDQQQSSHLSREPYRPYNFSPNQQPIPHSRIQNLSPLSLSRPLEYRERSRLRPSSRTEALRRRYMDLPFPYPSQLRFRHPRELTPIEQTFHNFVAKKYEEDKRQRDPNEP